MAVDPHQQERLQIREARLELVQDDIEGARKLKGWTAVAQLHRLAASLESEISDIRATLEQQATDDDAVLADLADLLAGLSDDVLRERLGVQRWEAPDE